MLGGRDGDVARIRWQRTVKVRHLSKLYHSFTNICSSYHNVYSPLDQLVRVRVSVHANVVTLDRRRSAASIVPVLGKTSMQLCYVDNICLLYRSLRSIVLSVASGELSHVSR